MKFFCWMAYVQSCRHRLRAGLAVLVLLFLRMLDWYAKLGVFLGTQHTVPQQQHERRVQEHLAVSNHSAALKATGAVFLAHVRLIYAIVTLLRHTMRSKQLPL